MAKVGRRWIIVYLYAYSKGESDDDLKVLIENSKESTIVEAGLVKSIGESVRSRYR